MKFDKENAIVNIPTSVSEIIKLPPSLRPPAWRWLVVMDYLADPTKDISSLIIDPYLYHGASFYRERKLQRLNKELKLNNRVRVPFLIYTASKPFGKRWVLEALLMSGAPYNEIASKFTGLTPDNISTYSKLFFDIKPILGSKLDVATNVLNASRSTITENSEYDFSWKLFSYKWGIDSFIEYLYDSSSLNKEQKKWFRDQQNIKLQEHAAHLCQDIKLLYKEEALNIVKLAREYWALPKGMESEEDSSNNLISANYMNDVMDKVDLVLLNAEMKLPQVESVTKFNIGETIEEVSDGE